MRPFLESVLAGEVHRDDIDDFVDRWHNGDAFDVEITDYH